MDNDPNEKTNIQPNEVIAEEPKPEVSSAPEVNSVGDPDLPEDLSISEESIQPTPQVSPQANNKSRPQIKLPGRPNFSASNKIPKFTTGGKDSQEAKPKSSKKRLLIILLILLLLAGAGAAYYFLVLNKDNKPTDSTETTQTSSNNQTSSGDIVVNGNTYFAEPKELKDLFLFKGDECVQGPDAQCSGKRSSYSRAYQVGITKDKQDIIVYRTGGGIDTIDILFVKNNDNYESIIPSNLDTFYIDNLVKDNVQAKSNIQLKELIADKEITIKEQPLVTPYEGISMAFLEYDKDGKLIQKKPEKGTRLFTKGNIEYYESSTDKDTYTINSIVAYFGDLFEYNYALSGELSSTDSTAAKNIKWSKGEQTSSNYYTGGSGCGSGAYGFVVAKVEKNELNEVGKTPGGQTVYQLSSSHPIVTELYEKDYNKGERVLDDANKNLTLEQFTNKHGYFLIENGLGEYMVMLSDALITQGGCAKPVIYLYPEVATKVDVSVGANVTVSDPLYPRGGWKQVLAQPNGRLSYLEKDYSSLFWEGTADGYYPQVRAGTVVKRSEAITTIQKQLAQQGLNAQETKDFIDFWKPNLPTTPYIRLSWLNTAEVNRLAPLNVTPKPDTVIRVFLDFEGLTKQTNIQPQRFYAPQRNGFTLVEWGGLARNGLGSLIQ